MASPEAPQPLTVSQLTAMVRQSLAEQFGDVTVVGEVTDLTRAASGHCYLSLKDPAARISAVIWRSTAERLKFRLEEGQQVVCRGGVEVYGPRGVYQLVIRSLQPVGVGPLELAFQQLYQRLKKEGLFESSRKRALPSHPERIAVVTSPQGAAIRDFLEVMARRWPAAQLTLVPTRVQGAGAAEEIAAAIALANRVRPAFDILVVCRGGGSLEDLWAFNEEPVCRAVYRSAVPVVSGVGHEVDVTLCDLTADLRALTPSEAAERIVPDRQELLQFVRDCRSRIASGLRQRLRNAQQTVDLLASRPVLTRPVDALLRQRTRVMELALRLPRPVERRLESARHQALQSSARLEALSPLSILNRGYSISMSPQGRVLRSVAEAAVGETVLTRLTDGSLTSQVVAIQYDEESGRQENAAAARGR